MSELRAHPFVVVLGEPGSGKSSVLQVEAMHAGSSVVTVRTLLNAGVPQPNGTLFLDALDEYRIEGQDADKVQRLSAAISQTKATQWRLTCRSEDWRKRADLAALQNAAGGSQIVVAKLLPLEPDESTSLLLRFGEADPERFMAKAETLGAGSLLRSPLSLKLLHRVVSRDGKWPDSRFELFEAAAISLAHEDNDDYKFTRRTAAANILAAAEETCLVYLVSGARAIWRSNSEPPRSSSVDKRAFLTAHDLQLEHQVVADMLDTGLFTGEGEEFQPLHRTMAEYLAARALAKLLRKSRTRPAFPFARAVAMITGADAVPPSELRGLYAWFAAHLSRQGEHAQVIRLIEADAPTVLLYGDVAAFNADERRAVLQQLDRHDPYFRAIESADSAIGALAQPDLATEFENVLRNPFAHVESHRLSTVYDALTIGRPIPELRSLLHDIALDSRRPEWHRARAADAWMHYADAVPRELFDALHDEPPTIARAVLRLHVAARFARDLDASEIQSLIADFALTPEDDVVGRLNELTDALPSRSIDGFFDVPVHSWMPDAPGRRPHSVDIEHALEAIFRLNVRTTAALNAERIWTWSKNLSGGIWSSVSERTQHAVVEWLDAEPRRESELFEVILADEETQEGPWQAPNAYIHLTRRYPSPGLTRELLDLSAGSPSTAQSARLRAVAVEIARRSADEELYAGTERRLQHAQDAELMERLRSGRVERQQEDFERVFKRDSDTRAARDNYVRILTPLLPELSVGRHPHHLNWAAEVYFSRHDVGKENDGNLARLQALTDEPTLAALFAGWDYLATRELIGAEAVRLAKLDAENRSLFVESAAFAGLHRRLLDGGTLELTSTPIIMALVAMRSRSRLRDPQMRNRIFDWALLRLDHQPELGSAELLTYWLAGLDVGLERLEPLWQLGESQRPHLAVSLALDQLLTLRPIMPAAALQSALRAALVHLSPPRLLELADHALTQIAEAGAPRRIWSFAAFALDPLKRSSAFLADLRDDAEKLFTDELQESVVTAFTSVPLPETSAAALREATLIELLGKYATVRDDSAGWYRAGPVAIVRGAIRALSSGALPNAGVLLTELATNPELQGWRSALRHAHASWATAQREGSFRHPLPDSIQAALKGGPPLNASDLLAVVCGELEVLQAEFDAGDSTPWKTYWNVDQWGRAIEPVVENECRNRLLLRLRDRLMPYDIVAIMPEARQRDDTRADMLIISHAGRHLPIEAKRHDNKEVWTAPGEQLAEYRQTQGADGYGVYLVFWFGNDFKEPPSRLDGRRPDSAVEFQALLISDLEADERERVKVVVFDTSRRG